MLKKSPSIKLPFAGVLFFSILLSAASFISGASWFTFQNTDSSIAEKNGLTFEVSKSSKPQLDFYVMSFCPYGNMMESVLKPVAELMGDKAEIRPRYIFEKISEDLGNYCKGRSADPNMCETYVKNSGGQLKSVAECKKIIETNLQNCKDEKNYLKIGNVYYSSLHGRVEANQNVREICAYKQTADKKLWWNFLDNVNNNCDAQNADTCWEEQAKKASLDTAKITECFNKEAGSLIEEEIAQTEKNKVSASPTVFVNGTLFPPEAAYSQDGKGSIMIGKKNITQDLYRTSNTIKEALCSAFSRNPKECKTVLANNSNQQAPSSGGCH